MKTFTLFWLTGEAQIVAGADIQDAVMHAGIGGGAIRALDFHVSGDARKDYTWNAETRSWDSTTRI